MRSRSNGWNKEREDTDDCNINPLGLYLHLTNGAVKKRMPRKCAPHRALASKLTFANGSFGIQNNLRLK